MENPGYEEQDVVPDVAFTAPLPRRSPVLSQPQSHANGQTNGDAGTPQAIQSQPGKGPSNACRCIVMTTYQYTLRFAVILIKTCYNIVTRLQDELVNHLAWGIMM